MFLYKFKEFFSFVNESENKTAVINFGRMNPPTVGHLKLMEHMIKVAKEKKAKALLFISHTHDKKKNPLDYESKFKFVDKIVPTGLKLIHSSSVKNIFQALEFVAKAGFDNVIIVAGSDRLAEFKKLDAYSEKLGLKSIDAVSAGERDPDNEGTSGISASKMRQFVKDDDYSSFKKYSPLKNDSDIKNMFDTIKSILK